MILPSVMEMFSSQLRSRSDTLKKPLPSPLFLCEGTALVVGAASSDSVLVSVVVALVQ